MNLLCSVRLFSPSILTVPRSVVKRKIATTTCIEKLHLVQRNDRSCIFGCGKQFGDICIKQSRFSSSQSKVPNKFKRKLLPFEVESELNKDIIIYTYHGKESFYRYFTFGGIFLFCAIMNSADLIFRFLRRATDPVSENEEIPWYFWWRKIDMGTDGFRITAASVFILFGFVILGFFLIFPTRFVREINLLKGGQKIAMETYRPFGRTKTVELSLKDISAQSGPKEYIDNILVKIRGQRFMYFVSNEGVFPDRKLFDNTIGQHRF